MRASNRAGETLGAPFPLKRRFLNRVLPILLLFVAALVISAGYAASDVVERIYLQLATRRAESIAAGVERIAPEPWRRMIAGQSSDEAGRARLTAAFQEEVREFGLTRLKVYSLESMAIFDTDPKGIGRIEQNPVLQSVARTGRPQAIEEKVEGEEHSYELYVPYHRDGLMVAIFELYEPVGFLDGILLESGLVAAALPAGLLVVLVVFLLLLVRRAQADIDRRTGAIDALRQRLASLVSRRAAELMQIDDGDALEARRATCTLLFTDIRGFTGFAEREPPERVIALLDRAFALQVRLVERWGGDVDKMLGDGLFARFDGPRAARQAVGCALAIQRDAARAGLPLSLGAGVFTGPVVIGVMGGSGRRDLTTIGDSVNVAARLCAQAEAGQIVCDASTAGASGLARGAPSEPIALKGRSAAIEIVRIDTGQAETASAVSP